MENTVPRYSMEEHARMGKEIYAKSVLPKVLPEDAGKFVAIDIETGDFEIGADSLTACNGLAARIPNSQMWLECIGEPAAFRMGGVRRTAR